MSGPFLAYGLGGKFDQSWNESASRGVAAWEASSGASVGTIEARSFAQYQRILERAAGMDFSPIIAIGFDYERAVRNTAALYPDNDFVLVTGTVAFAPGTLPANVRNVGFDEAEAAFAAAFLAATASETGTVGFIGAMLTDYSQEAAAAFSSGARAADPSIDVIVNFAGTTPVAFNDPVRGGELARSQMAAGADVIFASAGGTSLGVHQAVDDAGQRSIGLGLYGTDRFPDSVITSFDPNVQGAVFDALASEAGRAAGTVSLGFAEDGWTSVQDTRAAPLLTPALKARLDDFIADELGTGASGTTLPTHGDDRIAGTAADDVLSGLLGDDRIDGGAGNDTISGGGGADTLIGRDGDDVLFGSDGDPANRDDLRDLIYGGAGHDRISGDAGNDELRGDAGNDTIEGGFGVDQLFGGIGDDVLTGSAFSDLIFGGDGDDFVNGGFGYDRVNGGNGADRFFHLGVADHASDWIQDYDAATGDVLQYGAAASASDFQVNIANTLNAGDASIDEAFVIHKPSGQILWALVDGGGQAQITLRIGSSEFDLLA